MHKPPFFPVITRYIQAKEKRKKEYEEYVKEFDFLF